jgi:predicted naringenin-chalcone synthase
MSDLGMRASKGRKLEMNHADSSIAMLGIGTAVPGYRLDQADTSQRLAEALSEHPDAARWVKRIFKQCGVDSRYTCEPELLQSAEACRYFSVQPDRLYPTTAERMATYKRESVPLALSAARNASDDGQLHRAVSSGARC